MIIDASVGFKWLIDEPESDWALSWIGQIDLRVPWLFHAEVANALRKAVRRTELPADDDAFANLDKLGRLVTSVDERPAISRAFALSMEIGHSVYDCVYLALAEANNEDLLTADDKFRAKLKGTPYERRAVRLRPFG